MRNFRETRIDSTQCRHQFVRRTERRHAALLQRFASREDVPAEPIRIDDPDQPHGMRLTLALPGGFELEYAQVELSEHRTLYERHVLDVLERDSLLDLKQGPFAKSGGRVAKLAFELVVVVARPPLADAEKP